MTSRLAIELEKDPSVPFRASQTHIHHTWARTFHSRPELYIRPQSLQEIQKVVILARRLRRRVVTVGCGHSPSDITCTSAWMVNLDDYKEVLKVDTEKKTLLVQAGIRLHELNSKAKEHGLTMRSLGSIDHQSIAGAIATATHGSSLYHGLLSQSVRCLTIVLSNGQAIKCSKGKNEELFRAALVSLGALGIIAEVEFEMIDHTDIEWVQTIVPIASVYEEWDRNLWTQNEYTRVWWMPYMKRAIVWRAEKTKKPPRSPEHNWYGGSVGYHTYHMLLWAAQYIPCLLPSIEWFVFGMQYGFKNGSTISAVEELRTGLLMNCLYSQFVNEWALPLHKGPEALVRLTAWIHGDQATSGIPFSPKNVWVHSPIEVRVSDTSSASPRPYLDNTVSDGPTLYLNATLYRPYEQDPPCLLRYYQAFEWLMREMGGRPHWAKNFTSGVNHESLASMYGNDLQDYLRVRNDVDPEGMFVGEWHRRTILPPKSEFPILALEEKEVVRRPCRSGGTDWVGEQARWWDGGIGMSSERSESEESFDLMAGAEAETSILLESLREDIDDEEVEELQGRFHGNATEGFLGTRVFDKM
ncbi:L-gulonolactone/D-arabinono-1,4-lactone oxidase [Lepidopterella palustris CBS 459.81]|uniref:D-arabinono-1,4-lactone oxidase n=1 Tax=Lepidopterella palustris CBS 459.81 TaxID=1314670 RepID=A0A8E2JCR3_9PEZI|nr:L-gulonolactone/D-arabinono-1,4-lactone oxidase [Lepidopterella palustris CBS 459.81]